jgi:hypothetical protein
VVYRTPQTGEHVRPCLRFVEDHETRSPSKLVPAQIQAHLFLGLFEIEVHLRQGTGQRGFPRLPWAYQRDRWEALEPLA